MPLDACGCAVRRRTVADYAASPDHAGELADAPHRGEAAGEDRRLVWLGLWLDERRVVTRARFKATSCVALIAFAELACEVLETGEDPWSLDAAALRSRIQGAHPQHHDRAELVARALRAALPPRGAK